MRRRLQLRTMGNNTVMRLKHSSDMLIDEYVTKCQKVASQSDSIPEMRRLAAQMGPRALTARIQAAEVASLRWQKMGGEEIPIGYQLPLGRGADQLKTGDDPARPKEESDGWYRVGQKMLGFGAVATAVGWLLIGIGGDRELNVVNGAGVFLGVTVGPLTVLAGLITLLLGAAIDASDGP